MHPLVEGAAVIAREVVRQVGEKAVRRAVDSVMEDGQRVTEEMQRRIMNARAGLGAEPISVPFEVRPVNPRTTDSERTEPMGERRRRDDDDNDDRGRDDREDREVPPKEVLELVDLRDAETFLRHGWMLLTDLSENGAFPKKATDDLEEILEALRDRIEEREEHEDD